MEKGEARVAGEFLGRVTFELERKAYPQANRASIVYSFLRIADVVATKVGIWTHIDNDQLARLDVNIEIAEKCEGGIQR